MRVIAVRPVPVMQGTKRSLQLIGRWSLAGQMARAMECRIMLISPTQLLDRACTRKLLLQGGLPSGLQTGVKVTRSDSLPSHKYGMSCLATAACHTGSHGYVRVDPTRSPRWAN